MLAEDPVLGAWLAKAGREQTLTKALTRLLPPEMAATVRVLEASDTEVVLAATHGAAAARLRLLAPLLGEHIGREMGRAGISVRVVVSPRRAGASAGKRRPPRSIGAAGLVALRSLEERLPAGPLRDALERLVSEHQDESLEEKEQKDRA